MSTRSLVEYLSSIGTHNRRAYDGDGRGVRITFQFTDIIKSNRLVEHHNYLITSHTN